MPTVKWECVEHSKTYRSYGGWWQHRKRYHSDDTQIETTVSETGEVGGEVVYPPLAEWERSVEGEPAPGPEGPKEPYPGYAQASIAWKPVVKGAARFVNSAFLSDEKDFKVPEDDEAIGACAESIAAAGFVVKPPDHPVELPAYLPALIMVGGMFALPILAKYAPKFLERLDKWAGKEEKKTGAVVSESFEPERGGPR